jgi:type I restriction enzyme S subunit
MRSKVTTRDGWTRVRFGDVVRLSTERCTDPTAAGIDRYVGLEHLEPGDLRIRVWGNVADGVTFTNRFRPGQVLFGKRRAYQRKVAVAEFDGICSSDIYVFEPVDDLLLPELLPFICQTDGFFEHALKTSAGSLSPRTNWTSLADYEFDLPPIQEQSRGVSLLRHADRCMAALEYTAACAEKAVRALREDCFTSLSMVPLGELLSRIEAGSSVVGRNEPPSGKHEYGVLKVSAVGKNGFRPEESKVLLNPEDFVASASVKARQLLITRCNTPDLVGMACIVDRDHPNLMLCDKTLDLVPRSGIAVEWLWHALQLREVREQLKAVASGTGAAMKNISQASLRAIRVRVPPRDAQEIVDKLSEAMNAERTIRNRLSCARLLRSRTLARVLSGR